MTAVPVRWIAQWRSGDWLTRCRVKAYTLILLTVEIAIFGFLVAGTHGWIVPLDKPNTTDFVSFYAAGALADAGTPALAYDQAAHLAAEEAVVGRGIEYQFFNYPPVYQALFIPISRLPYLVAFIGFETATLLLYLAVARRILGDYGGTALLALIAFPMVWWNIGLGQNAFLTAALFGAATLLVDRRPGLAGICFGALCYKPHFAVLVPLALAAGGHWRVIAAAAATAAVLIALSVAVLGWATWQAFFITAGTSHSMYESGRILFAGFVSPFGAVRLLGGGIALGYAVQAVFAIVAAAIVAIVWWRGASLPARAAVLASASLIASPVSLLYDLMLGTIAACWLLRDGGHAAGWEKAVVAVMYVFLLGSRYFAETISLPVNTIVATCLLAMATRRAWREFGFTAPWRQQPDATPSR